MMKPKCARRVAAKLRRRYAGKNGVVPGWAWDFGWPDPTINRKRDAINKRALEKEKK